MRVLIESVNPSMALEAVLAIQETMRRNSIDTLFRQIHFLAQIGHESGSFRWTRELASGADYEGRLDLGNTEVGDGPRFRGRGLIQLTGRANYQAYSRASGIDFVSNPERLETYPYAALVAGWFWKINGLNRLADRDDLRAITRRINGGFNGLADREQRYLELRQTALSRTPVDLAVERVQTVF